jgi:hypothetical protein
MNSELKAISNERLAELIGMTERSAAPTGYYRDAIEALRELSAKRSALSSSEGLVRELAKSLWNLMEVFSRSRVWKLRTVRKRCY